MHTFDLAVSEWTDVSGKLLGDQPTPRKAHGVAFADGKLYIHGGDRLESECFSHQWESNMHAGLFILHSPSRP
jgi:hypothetical protein